jgi:uncharacterized protein YbbK (DUF523 family)
VKEKPKILVSACLLGEKVRYDGGHKRVLSEFLMRLIEEDRIVSSCPELAGGLAIPRMPAEIFDGQVFDTSGQDVTDAYKRGAMKTLEIAKIKGCQFALLKNDSPSCGVSSIYDGSFTGQKISGQGFTAKLLSNNGISVFHEGQLKDLEIALSEFSRGQ